MGPRFCKRGNRFELMPSSPAHLLQWGHAFVSVETLLIAYTAPSSILLQWGHAFVSVETWLLLVPVRDAGGASMGPRFCKRGNYAGTAGRSYFTKLQWGHAFVSVETLGAVIAAVGIAWLQWGHAFVSVETRQPATPPIRRLSSFNGATLL